MNTLGGKSRIVISLLIIGIIVVSSIVLYMNFINSVSTTTNTTTSTTTTTTTTTPEGPIFKGGTLTQNETWSGSIFVNESILVPTGITLTINPGTRLMFQPNRGYKTTKSVGFSVAGGTVIAVGTSDQQIWFTSDTDAPINGDWGGIELHNTNSSIFKYVIIEFAGLGIAQFDSNVTISHSIVRWVNLEGIYMERSSPVIEYNLVYQNGYHEIALEQYNHDVIIRNNIFAGGHVPFIVFDSSVTVEGNYFYNYNTSTSPAVSVAGFANATVIGNKFDGFNNDSAILKLQPMSILTKFGNDFGNGSVPIPDIGFPDSKTYDLGYTPGDLVDQYMYVYDTLDETRRAVSRIGTGLGFGWAFEYANGYLWKLETGNLVQIDPILGNSTDYPINSSVIFGPRGLCYDGEYFWAQDHTLLKIVKFKVNESGVVICDSFPIPESETGGRQCIATDGTFLYLPDRTGSSLFEIHKNGTVNRKIYVGLDLVGPFTWNGTHFWSSYGNIMVAWTKEGQIVGKIYDVAAGCSGLTWDGMYLWGIYKTCELWNDAKIFQIEILNDSWIT